MGPSPALANRSFLYNGANNTASKLNCSSTVEHTFVYTTIEELNSTSNTSKSNNCPNDRVITGKEDGIYEDESDDEREV